MQEYSLLIRKTLRNGLRPRDFRRGGEYLTQCQFVKPKKWGLRSCSVIEEPFEIPQVVSWPFPQLIRGKEDTLLLEETSIMEIDESAPYWEAGPSIVTYDVNDIQVAKDIIGSGVWHMADFHNVWLLFNGVDTVLRLNESAMFDEPQRFLVQNDISINTGCASRGRLFMGGLDPKALFKDDWGSLWEAWTESASYSMGTTIEEVSTNFVMWSTIGGGDVIFLFRPDKAIGGYLEEDERDIDDSFYMDLWRRNEMGFMPMPWKGTVLKVEPLGEEVIVCGDSGIAALYRANAPYPTIGLRHISPNGVAGRGCVGSDGSTLILLDNYGFLWAYSSEGGLKKLGYKEYLEEIIGQDVIISPGHDKEFYICGVTEDEEARSFVLTENGLCRCPQRTTGLASVDGVLVGVEETDPSTEVLISTVPVDFGFSDVKTVTTMELGLDHQGDVHVGVDFRYSRSDEWSSSEWVPVNPEGFARIQITALEFKFKIRCTTYEGFALDYATIRWQASGRRTRRGLGAETTVA